MIRAAIEIHAGALVLTHWTLCADLAKKVLGKTLSKDPAVRLSNWEDLPLSAEQQHYAATDAYASLRICQVNLEASSGMSSHTGGAALLQSVDKLLCTMWSAC